MNTFSVRPMKEEDIPLIVNYWKNCSEEDFLRMGLDTSKFIIATEFEENLKSKVLDITQKIDASSIDGVHLDREGNKALAELIYNKISIILPL